MALRQTRTKIPAIEDNTTWNHFTLHHRRELVITLILKSTIGARLGTVELHIYKCTSDGVILFT